MEYLIVGLIASVSGLINLFLKTETVEAVWDRHDCSKTVKPCGVQVVRIGFRRERGDAECVCVSTETDVHPLDPQSRIEVRTWKEGWRGSRKLRSIQMGRRVFALG